MRRQRKEMVGGEGKKKGRVGKEEKKGMNEQSAGSARSADTRSDATLRKPRRAAPPPLPRCPPSE